MSILHDFSQALTHWSFGISILVGLVASEFTGGETVLSIFVAAFSSTLSALCGAALYNSEETYRRKRLGNVLYFLIIWLDILTNLVAASTCARLASATVDYISKGHFREFLFGLEQHSLGEPWPDVLGVTIIVVITVMFMVGLEKSSAISTLLLIALIGNFAFFATIGSFHTVTKFWKWCENFKIHSAKTILKASALCSFAFVHNIPKKPRNSFVKLYALVINPMVFYTVIAIIFSLMTNYRELSGTAIPLIQVFENRDVDWARPVIAVFTISVACLVQTETLPSVYMSFVKLASKEWQIFVSSIQYHSHHTGAPILAIFAAGSLAAILAFACPLSLLIKLLNTSCLLKCVITSIQIVYNRYKPEVFHDDCLVFNTNVQYSKLNQTMKSSNLHSSSVIEKLKSCFGRKSNYVHRVSSPKSLVGNSNNIKEERECLLLDDYSNKSINIDLADQSCSDNEDENDLEVVSCNDEESDSSTDIDIIVEEYRQGLKVATVGKFNEIRPSTRVTSLVVSLCLAVILVASINISLYNFRVIHVYWPDVVAIILCVVVMISMPQNASDKSRESVLPSFLFPTCHALSIVINLILSATIIADIWQGIVFWTLAGLLLFWRCDCCTCEGLAPVPGKDNPLPNSSSTQAIIYEYKGTGTDSTSIAR